MFGGVQATGRRRTRRLTAFVALIGFQWGAIVALHSIGSESWLQVPWTDLFTWIAMAPLEDVVAALLRSVALGIAYWIAITTAAYSAARLTRIPALIRATARTTLPTVRGVIDRAVAITVTTAALSAPLGPAFAAGTAPPPPPSYPVVYQISDRGVPTPLIPQSPDPTLIVPPGVTAAGYTPTPAGAVGPAAQEEPQSKVYEVVAGDNLWTIAARHATAALPDHEVDTATIAVYWRRVIEANTPRLRSGDPNLIYPGESIQLPAIGQGGSS
jgi:hypothetical protein